MRVGTKSYIIRKVIEHEGYFELEIEIDDVDFDSLEEVGMDLEGTMTGTAEISLLELYIIMSKHFTNVLGELPD